VEYRRGAPPDYRISVWCFTALNDGNQGEQINAMLWGFRIWFMFGVAGMFAAFKAFARNERLWGVTAIAFLLNAAAVLIGMGFLRS
jgi:hypothetical protein